GCAPPTRRCGRSPTAGRTASGCGSSSRCSSTRRCSAAATERVPPTWPPGTVAAMALITGERSVEIDAPIEQVFAIAADIERAPEWQGSLQEVDVESRDGDGR